MKEAKRDPVIDFKNIKLLPLGKIQGQILTSMISDNENLCILTDNSFFYFKEKDKEKKELFLIPSISKDQERYQTEQNNSQIWIDKFGFHIIISHDKRLYYYNPSFSDNPLEIDLKNDKYLEPYAVAFNNNILSKNNKNSIEFLLSDFFSDIYDIKIKIEKGIPKVEFINLVYKFRKEDDAQFNEDDNDFPEFNFFEMEKNERITDIKILNSSRKDKNELLIVAVTKNSVFKFSGTGTFKEIFDKYTIDKDDFLKVYKKLGNNQKEKDFRKCRLELLKSYSHNSMTRENLELCMGWMSSCGYILEEIPYVNEKIMIKKNFSVFPYIKLKFDGTKDYKPIPIAACQSKLHIFFLYSDSIVVTNKLNKNIIHVEYLLTKYNDIYYMDSLNSLILSDSENILILNLENEDKYIWENYIETGNFDLAIKSLSKEEENIKPKLHRLNADKLFKEEKYQQAASEYVLSDELFESVCVKFILAHQSKALLKYLYLMKNSDMNIPNKKDDNKYLIYTWIAEILIEQNNNNSNMNLKDFIEEIKHNHTDKYIDKMTYYFLLLNNDKKKEFSDYAIFKGDYELIIQNMLNHLDYDGVLNNLEKFISSDIDDRAMKKLINILFEYSNYFMRESPIKTINLLETGFISETNQDEIVKVIINSNIKQETKKGNYDSIINYIRKLIKKNVMNSSNSTGDKNQVSSSTINNLHNLYLLFLSLSDKPEHKKEIIEYLKGPLYTYTQKNNYLNVTLSNKEIHIDLNFAQKILKNNYPALALVYCLMGRYNESILIALEHNEKDIAIFIAQSIKDGKIKRDIWLRIFKYFKINNFADAKNILESSGGILKIEDILPFVMDNVKLEELKDDLQSCINFYEEGVQQLKQEINGYNQSTEVIKKDLFKIQKKSTYINYTQIKCEKCQKDILDAKFFLFPCGHIFDTFCLIKILVEYDEQNIGDEIFKQKIKNIKALKDKIKILQEKRKKIINEQKLQNSNTFSVFFNFINTDQREEFSKEEEMLLKQYSDNLYSLLKEECVLCGKEMINSTQIKLGEDNNKKWNDLV